MNTPAQPSADAVAVAVLVVIPEEPALSEVERGICFFLPPSFDPELGEGRNPESSQPATILRTFPTRTLYLGITLNHAPKSH